MVFIICIIKMEILSNNSKKDLHKLRSLKSLLLISIGLFIIRYLLLLINTIWSDIFTIQRIPVLFLCQVGLALIAFSMLCYGLLSMKDYLATKKQKRIMNSVVITLLTMIVLITVMLFTWVLASFFPDSPSFPYELWIELIFIAMPFTELIPFSLAMLFLSHNFWLLKKVEGWRTNVLITPFFFLPLTIIRIVAAIFKIFNILDSSKYPFAWNMADYTRIISAIFGIILFIEIFINFWRIKPKLIVQKKNAIQQN